MARAVFNYLAAMAKGIYGWLAMPIYFLAGYHRKRTKIVIAVGSFCYYFLLLTVCAVEQFSSDIL